MNLELRKQLVLDLKKDKGIEGVKAKVALVLDRSGSMNPLYKDGTVDQILERVLPIGLAFDDDGEVDFYIFHNTVTKMKYGINSRNYNSGIAADIHKSYSTGGTSYAPAIRQVVEDLVDSDGIPVFVIFVTDGANDDVSDTKKAMREVSKKGAFFQFVGIGKADFPFLEKLDDLDGRMVDNASFIKAADIIKMDDKELYTKLLGEFPQWLTAAKAKNIVK